MGNNLQKKRIIKVSNIQNRIPKLERQNLKEAFDRIQDGQVINEYQFRVEVLGPQVPETIAMKLFQLFTSEDSVPEVMNFEDLASIYIVFKHGKTDELGQVCFELMKMTTGTEYLSREHISLFTEKLINLNEQVVHSFYAKTEFDPRLPIKKDEFVSAFKKVHTLALFTWVLKLVEGYSRENMNMEEGKSTDFQKRLTMLSHEKTKNETEKLGFDTSEHDNMQEFFSKEIKRNDAKEVLRTIGMLFKDIRNTKLKKYFIEALTKHTDDNKKLEFLFDMFSNHTDSMKKKQMKEFAEIFKLGPNYFHARGQALNMDDFISDVKDMGVEFDQYEKCKFQIISMMGLHPSTEDEEREAILSALNYNHNLEAYINDHLDEEDTFYIMEKQFFDAWSMNIGFIEEKSFVIKKEKIKIIDNASLMEPFHEQRLREVLYNEDFIIVPKFVFYPFIKWYKCTRTIERKVISYKQQKNKAISLFKQRGKTSSVIVQAQQIPDNFYKVIGDTTYELEIYPKFIYYERINDKGERPHQKAIVNQKIDQTYMKKVLKTDKIPFQELLISRKANFEEVLKQISINFKENPKRGRLWIEDQVISGAKLEETLDEFGISIGQVIYVEYASANNQWPTDGKSGSQSSSKSLSSLSTNMSETDRKDAQKTQGLYNLGNTCYMNSALQCLANTRFFYEYFCKEKRYIKQMNLKSKHGHQGELAQNFAQLLQKMWSNGQVAFPKPFKNCISQISEQFQGYEQQDSQEFLSFLLDGLHEELNLRQEKPYIENPDSDKRDVVELGLEQWSNALRRDYSFIFFIFHGQLKSALSCQTCNKISTTFDIFTNIPLSLPEPSKILLNVIVYRLPNDIKDLINGENKNMLRRIDSARSDDIRVQSNQGERDINNLYKFQESFKYITNDQPIHISLRVDKDIKIAQLMQMITEVKEVNIDPTSKVSNLCLYSQSKGIIRGIFNSEYRLTQYNLITNEVEAIETLSRKGRDLIRDFYKNHDQILEQYPNAPLTCLLGESEKVDESLKQNTQSSTTASKRQKSASRSSKDNSVGVKIDKCNLFNSYQIAYERYQDFEDNNNFPDEIYAVGYHRRFIKKAYYFFCPYQPQLLSSPIIFVLPLKPTGRRIYEEVWAVASNLLKKSSIYHNKKNRWWEQANWKEKIDKKDEIFKPFVIKTVDRSGFSCSQCNWMQMCSGCVIPPTDVFIEEFFKKCHLAIEWHSQLIEDDYNNQANEVLHHSSTQDKEIVDEDYINLEDCLRKFHEVEEIGSADHIYCSNCKKPQGHFKKLEIFRPPPILVIQLKRFKFSNTHRNKLTTLVEFPLYNLDVSTFVTDQQFLNSQGIETKYDLYAIINHYGTLTFGHYISLVKNQQDQKWYKYDDSSRTQISEESIQKEFAYILFYIRKDVEHKNLDEVFHNIKDLFPGKPVKTEKGDAFVLQKVIDSTNEYKIQFEKGKDTEVITLDQILEEKDSNEILYDAKEMQEIESNKKERLNEINRKKKTRRCAGFCSSFTLIGVRLDPTSSRRPNSNQSKKKRGSVKSNIANNRGQSCYIF